MQFGNEWTAAYAATAAAAGLCFASGRTTAMFFSQTGRASWFGVAAAAVLYGALCAGICRMAQKTGAVSFSGACRRCVGDLFGRAAGCIHAGLSAAVLLAMLNIAGNLAALALPLRNAYPMGAAAALCAAFGACACRMRGLAVLGALATVFAAVFFTGHALDTSAVRLYGKYETVAELDGSAAAAAVLAVIFAALCALVCADAAAGCARRAGNPLGFGMKCGGILAAALSASNAAVLRGGQKLLSQGLPAAVLSARWGKTGFYACILMMFLCASAAIAGILAGMTGAGGKT